MCVYALYTDTRHARTGIHTERAHRFRVGTWSEDRRVKNTDKRCHAHMDGFRLSCAEYFATRMKLGDEKTCDAIQGKFEGHKASIDCRYEEYTTTTNLLV